MCPKIVNQKSYTEVQIRLLLHTFMQILRPSTKKLWPGHRLRRKNKNQKNYTCADTILNVEIFEIDYYPLFIYHRMNRSPVDITS